MDTELVLIRKAELTELIDAAITKALARDKPVQENNKKVLALDEAVEYLNTNGLSIAKSTIYKLTSTNQIPFKRFGGRKIVFRVDDLNAWIGEQLTSTRDNSVCKNVARSARRKAGF